MARKKGKSTEVERFHSTIEINNGCWEWKGYVMNSGYGAFATKKGTMLVHRWSYEHFVGAIEPKMTIDHLCRNKVCANPDHLEQVTRTENIQRAGLTGVASREAKKTHCTKGHSYAEHGVRYRNGYTKYGTAKFARRCTLCTPKYAKYWPKGTQIND